MSIYPNSSQGYASPSMTLALTVLLLIFSFIGFVSLFLCRCFVHTFPFYNRFAHPNPATTDPEKSPPLGLDPMIINSYPTFSYSVVKDLRIEKFSLECAICICEFMDDDVLRLFTKCFHVFHQDCIDLWLKNHKTCPVCRGDLDFIGQQQLLMCGINENEPLENPVYMPHPHDTNVGSESVVSIVISDPVHEMGRETSGEARVAKSEKLDKFLRSHSTGHSIKKKDDLDRFTLRLPEHLQARLLRGHNWTGSCTTFGELTSRTKTGFGEISDVAGRDWNRV